ESQRKLQSIRDRYRRLPDQSLLLWLYECWFAGAHVDVLLDSAEAKQLGSLSRDVAVDRGLGRRTGTHSLWMRLVWSVRAAHSAEELLVRRDSWDTRLEGVQYLTELSVASVLFGNTRNSRCLEDLDRAYCTWDIWQAFRESAPPLYAEALSSIRWNGNLKVLKLKAFIWDYRLKPSSPPQNSSSYVEEQPQEYAGSSNDPCTICHEELGRNSCELECGHEFHRECIRTWLLEHSSTCPICRDYAVLPADVPQHPAQNNSKRYKAKPWKRSGF
ncbi:DZIP3 ligase, partial [Leptocoma aspasia]|nr:DZIP3 ligase [Leptocoma aspasia]